MELLGELKKWVSSLSIAEKRFIKLIGKARAGATASQQLELFDWLNRSQGSETTPGKVQFMKNLPTVSLRLKELILDGLRLLHKEDNTDAILRTTLDEIAILHEKKLDRVVGKQLKRAKKLALSTSRYIFACQCIEWELKIAQASAGSTPEMLEKLREEELDILKKLSALRELQHRHDSLIALMRQSLFHRDAQKTREINNLVEHELIYKSSESGNYTEQALAVNILGLKDLNDRNATAALLRYRKLLTEWKKHEEWQNDQSALLLLICKFFQIACFFSPVDWENAQQYISMVHDFKGLAADTKRDFQRMLYHNQFTLALNTGRFDSVKTLIPEIEQWLSDEAAHLTEIQVLPFLCNFAIAEFLKENYASANRIVSRILNMPNRNARNDIREFALVLQGVLQLELNNTGLNEYLTRAGKRRFSKSSSEINFELVVFRHLDNVIRTKSPQALQDSVNQFIYELDNFAEQVKYQIPVLGLNEIRMWAKSKQTGESLTGIFLEALKKNIEELEQTEML